MSRSSTRSTARQLLEGLYVDGTSSPLIGLAIAIVFGMSLAIIMSQARWLERRIWPYLVALQAIPILALVPIIARLRLRVPRASSCA